MRVAVLGSGGVGGYFGARLAQAGNEVTFLARGAHLAAMRRDGLRVESVAGDVTIAPVRVFEEPADAGVADVVLVAVKAWQVREAAGRIGPLLGPETFVVPLQNGVEATGELAEVLGADRVVTGLCRLVSYVAAPGVVRHAGVAPELEVGERPGGPAPRARSLVDAFAGAPGVSASVSPDIEAAIWTKFLFISSFSGVGALTGLAAGPMRSDAGARAMLGAAMEEVAALARARGVRIAADAVARTMGYVDALPAEATASMQRDIRAGRPSELDNQNGAVVRLALEQGLAVPVHRRIRDELLPSERRARAAAGI